MAYVAREPAKEQRQRSSHERGRGASSPRGIPPRGWWDIARSVWSELGRDNVAVIAAGVAFFGLLAVVPGIAALVSIYGLAADPATLQQHLAGLEDLMPASSYILLQEQLVRSIERSPGSLSLGAAFGIVISLWSANKGMRTMLTALNIAYNEADDRHYVKKTALALLFTIGAVGIVVFSIGLIVIAPIALAFLGLDTFAEWTISLLRWPVLLAALVGGLALLYRYGPNRAKQHWRWIGVGTGTAAFLWLVGSLAFSLYVENFGSYDRVYGSLGAVVILLMWFYLSAWAILLGAELNSEIERHTKEETTTDAPRPLRQRGAHVAGTAPEAS